MVKNVDEIVVASNGSLYVAPVGTTLPTSETATLTGFTDLGYVTEDGVKFALDESTKKVMGWQSFYALRNIVESKELSLEATLLQWNDKTLVFALGGGTVTEPTSGKYKFVPAEAEEIDERSIVLDWLDGDKKYRLVIPRGKVSGSREISFTRTDAAPLPVKIEVLSDGTLPPFILYTNDPAFEAGS